MPDEKVDKELCTERMEAQNTDIREIKADVKTLLQRSGEAGVESISVKESLNTLWTQFNGHKESHWKWVAVWLGILSAVSASIGVIAYIIKGNGVPH